MTGEVTPSKGQSRAEVGRWTGDWIQWDQGGQKESEVWNLKGEYGFLVHDPTDEKKNNENNWIVPFKSPLVIEGNPPFPAFGHGSYLTSHRILRMYVKTKTCHRPQIRFQNGRYGFAQIPCEKFPNVGNAIGIMFFPDLDKDDPDPYPGTWRQRYQAQTSLRIVKPGAKAGEKVRVRVRGRVRGGSDGRDKEHTALDARIIASQIADLRITGRNPKAEVDEVRAVPVNVDLSWQFSFDLYSNGRAGRSDQHVELTQQELKLELLGSEVAQTSAALSDVNYAFNQNTKMVSGQGPVSLGLVNGTTSKDALVGKTLELGNLMLAGCSKDRCEFRGGNLRFREGGQGKAVVLAQFPNVTAVADLKAGTFHASVPMIPLLSNELASGSPLLAALRKGPGKLELDGSLIRVSKRFTQSGKAMQGPSTALYADLPANGPVLAKPVPLTPPVPLTRPGQTGNSGNFKIDLGGLPDEKVTKLEPPKLTPKVGTDEKKEPVSVGAPPLTPPAKPASPLPTNSLTVKPPVVLSIPGVPPASPSTGIVQAPQTSSNPSDITTTKLADGSIVSQLPGGASVIKKGDGTVITKLPEGATYTVFPDGTTFTQLPGGGTITKDPRGNTSTRLPDGTKIQLGQGDPRFRITLPTTGRVTEGQDGSQSITQPDGTTTTISGFGDTVTRTPDGTVIYTNGAGGVGHSTTIFPSGASLSTLEPNQGNANLGNKAAEIGYPDKSRVRIDPDGTITMTLPGGRILTQRPDGTKITKEPNGTTTTTYPDGRTVSSPPLAPPNPLSLGKPAPVLTIPGISPSTQGIQVQPVQPSLSIPSNKSLSLGLPQKPAGSQPVPQQGSNGIQFSPPGVTPQPSAAGSVPLVQQAPGAKAGGTGFGKPPVGGLIIPRGVESGEEQTGNLPKEETGPQQDDPTDLQAPTTTP